MAEPLLTVDQVSKSYGEVRALHEVSLTVRAGEFVALLGPNGAGKSTLMQLVTGLFTPDSGKILVLGHDLTRSATRALAGIGVVFQQQTLDLELTVQANLLYHADLHGLARGVARDRIARLLKRYDLNPRARTRTLSGGNRRRVELARALLHQPRILLMDEATVGLDPNSRRELLADMDALTRDQQLGVLWTTHLIDEVAHADRLIMLERGQVLYEGTADALLAQHATGDLEAVITSMMGGNRKRGVLADSGADLG